MTELMEEIHNNIPKVFVNYMLLFNVSQVCMCVINRCLYHSTIKNTSMLMFNLIKVCVSYKVYTRSTHNAKETSKIAIGNCKLKWSK